MSFLRIFYSKTPKIKDENGKIPPNSMASLEKVIIGNFNQSLLIRGHDINNPILLILHGGPGYPKMPSAYYTQRLLEKHFIVVNWDQRGAGKSYSRTVFKKNLNVEQYILDTKELVEYLIERFKKEKIFLLGHSWGSLLGTLVVQRYPELFHAYIGMGQVINMIKGENISYQYVLDAAKKEGNQKVIDKLKSLNPPYGKNIKELLYQRKWLTRYGGAIHGETSEWVYRKKIFKSPEYSLRDDYKLLRGVFKTLKIMWEQMIDINFLEQVPELKVPVYFFEGRHDYQVPFELVEIFFDKLKAPKKKLIWFEYSGHSPNLQETEKFEQTLISELL